MRSQIHKSILLVLFSFSLAIPCFSQDTDDTSKFWDHVRYGGGIGISTGSNFFSATIAPSAIYEFNDYVALGLGLNSTFNSSKNVYKSTILGGSLLSLFNPIPELQLSAEFEELHVSRNFNDAQFIDEDYWYPALFVGAGYRSNNITFGLRYDLLFDNDKSIYADAWIPFVRVYF